MARERQIIATAIAASIASCSATIHPRARLIWNASASEPVGLYAVREAGRLRVSDLVVVQPPLALARFMDRRRYLPAGLPMLKEIAALPGQIVCRDRSAVRIDGRVAGEALDRDFAGRSLPVWSGCERISRGQVFFLNARSHASFDSRYFGTLPVGSVVGEATPLWVRRGN